MKEQVNIASRQKLSIGFDMITEEEKEAIKKMLRDADLEKCEDDAAWAFCDKLSDTGDVYEAIEHARKVWNF